MATKKEQQAKSLHAPGDEAKPVEQNAPQAYDDAGIEADKNEFSAGPSAPAVESAEPNDDE